MRPHGTQKQLEQRRRRAVELLKQGLNLPAVAEKIGCSVSSVHLWREEHKKNGDEGLMAKSVPGRPAKLNKRQKQSLVRVLLKGAVRNGYSTDLWTTRRICEVIGKRFAVAYHPNHIWRLLQEMGWSCQKPTKRAKERNEKEIEHWKRFVWPHIKKLRKAWHPACLPRRKRLLFGS